jgi:hypothetical protein
MAFILGGDVSYLPSMSQKEKKTNIFPNYKR